MEHTYIYIGHQKFKNTEIYGKNDLKDLRSNKQSHIVNRMYSLDLELKLDPTPTPVLFLGPVTGVKIRLSSKVIGRYKILLWP